MNTNMPPRLPGGPAEPLAKEPLPTQVQRAVLNGRRVQSQTDDMAVMVKGKRPNHILHLILTIVPFGMWGIVWIILARRCTNSGWL